MTHAPTPGPLSEESAGPYSCIRCDNSTWNDDDICDQCAAEACAPENAIDWPDADGWMSWDGAGTCPVQLEQMVEYRTRSGDTYTDPAGALFWPHTLEGHDIIAFRLAPTAPVEASGSELKADFVRSHPSGMDDSTYEKIEDALDRADAPVTGPDGKFLTLAQRVDTLRPQPSGETRAALDRLKMAAHVYEDDEMAADCATLEALLSARPLALGGQHSGPPLCEDEGCPQHGAPHICTTPARAEAQDEGAAGELVAVNRDEWTPCSPEWLDAHPHDCGRAPRVAAKEWDGHSHYHPVNWPRSEHPVAWRFRDHPSGGWVYTGLGGRHDGCEVQPLYAHPSPTPAADADRVREAIALAEYVCGLLPSLAGAADQPDNKVYAAYANKREIMGARDRLATLKAQGK